MRQDFIMEFDYFKNRYFIFSFFNKIIKEVSRKKLTGCQIYINNIPTSLEFYVSFCFDKDSEIEIEKMKAMLFPIGIYRPDISQRLLLKRLGERGFNSYPIESFNITYILEEGFWFSKPSDLPTKKYFTEDHIQRLKKDGYNAFEKLVGGTTLFISHSSKQKTEMERVIPYLNSCNELIWLDKFRLKQVENEKLIKRQIAEGLNQATKVLLYITSDFLESYWCDYELKLSKQIYNEKKDYELLFVIYEEIKDSFFSKYKDIIEDISQDNYIIINCDIKLEYKIEKLINRKKSFM